jgi:hypothetical protein
MTNTIAFVLLMVAAVANLLVASYAARIKRYDMTVLNGGLFLLMLVSLLRLQ